MSDGIYQKVQLGRQSVVGTAVAATTVFPVDTGWLGFELDRASESPDEDFGSSSREQTGRESTGVRYATSSLPFVCRFQDFMHPLEMHVAGSVAPSGAGPYVYTYTYDDTSTTLKPYTVQYGVAGSTSDEWRATGVWANSMQIGFDALSGPGNSMWKGSLGLSALDRGVSSLTSAQSAPATLETMEGHTTTLNEGAVGTAFGSLSALTASLKQFSMTSDLNLVGRAYGGATDIATAHGKSSKGTITFNALVVIGSTSKTDIHDIFNVAGSVATERRWRITITGTGTNVMTIDGRVKFRAVPRGDHQGERLYAVSGVFVNDATLAGRAQFILTNSVASVP